MLKHKFRTLRLVGITLVVFCALTTSIFAATIQVTSQIGQPGCDLVDAITTANSNTPTGGCIANNGSFFGGNQDLIVLNFAAAIDEFIVSSVDNGDNGLPLIVTDIKIIGRGGTDKVVIKRSDAPATPDFRLFFVTQSGHLSLENISIRNGKLPSEADTGNNIGGAVYVQGGQLDVDGSDFTNNQGFSGGALYLEAVNDNPAQVIVRDTFFQGNRSTRSGGAIVNDAGELTIIDSEFVGNQSGGNGGALYANLNSNTILRKTLFLDNSAEQLGGAIDVFTRATLSVYDSTISGNAARNETGGGISVSGRSDMNITVTNTTITNNEARVGGGIGVNGFDTHADSTFAVVNSLISGNSGLEFSCCSRQEISFGSDADLLSFSNSLIGHTGITTAQALSTGLILDASNILATSDGDTPTALNNILLPLANNGGLTRTHALVPNSPAIDKATDGTVVQVFVFSLYVPGCRGDEIGPAMPIPPYRPDQRGIDRPSGSACDIGAFEFEEDESHCFVIKAANNKVVTFCL